MRWKVDKDILSSALQRVEKVVKSNPRSVEILHNILLDSLGEDLYVTAKSNMASVRIKLDGAIVHDQGSIVVNFDKFRDRISKTEGEVVLDYNRSSLSISSSSDQRLGISLGDSRLFPTTKWNEEEESYSIKVEDFIELLRNAAKITSSATALTPSFMQIKIKDQLMYCSSGIVFLSTPINVNPSLVVRIPNATLTPLAAFLKADGVDRVWVSQGGKDSMSVSVGCDQFQATPLALDFPDITELLERVRIASSVEISFDKSLLTSALRNARSTAGDGGLVTLSFSGLGSSTMHIETQSSTGDWFESSIPCNWYGSEDFVLEFQIDSLIGFLSCIPASVTKVAAFTSPSLKDKAPLYVKEGEFVAALNQYQV